MKASSLPFLAAQAAAQPSSSPRIDLRRANVVMRPGNIPNAERTAAAMLVEEIANRCGVRLPIATDWPASGPAIAITSEPRVPGWKRSIPEHETRPEGYRLYVDQSGGSPTTWIVGADARGALFGVGRLLRELNWARGDVWLDGPPTSPPPPLIPFAAISSVTALRPTPTMRGSPRQFEKYIRELTFFGVNSIEGIPFQDSRPTPVMKVGRREMNKAIGQICHRYGLDYWLWLPAEFDLKDTAERTKLLNQSEELFRDCPVAAVFFPGGDPGNNPPELVLPFLEDLSRRMLPLHPTARIWLSLQWFNAEQIDYIYRYISQEAPKWFAGLVAGPSSPPARAHPAASPRTVSATSLSRPHAQQALPVRGAAMGPGLRANPGPRGRESASGRICGHSQSQCPLQRRLYILFRRSSRRCQ